MKENLFLVIELYLDSPTTALAEKIKESSTLLRNEAYKRAYQEAVESKKSQNPYFDEHTEIRIGADEYQPKLMDLIAKQAEEAFPFSMRFIKNEQEVTQADPAYLFMLSSSQHRQLYQLKGELLRSQKYSPDGLIFAYNGYIERRTGNEYQKQSQFSYCTELEAGIYDHLVGLYLKAKELSERGEEEASQLLFDLCDQIKDGEKNEETIEPLLKKALEEPVLQQHRGVKLYIVNFLMVFSVFGLGYLAVTSNNRGSFWYHPNTDTENTIENFQQLLSG